MEALLSEPNTTGVCGVGNGTLESMDCLEPLRNAEKSNPESAVRGADYLEACSADNSLPTLGAEDHFGSTPTEWAQGTNESSRRVNNDQNLQIPTPNPSPSLLAPLLGYSINDCENSINTSEDVAQALPHMVRKLDEGSPPNSSESPSGSRGRWTLGCLCALSLSAGLFVSLLAPFYPTQAKAKGASELEVGFIFGSFQLIVALSSPLFGRFLTVIGSKFMLVAGNFVCSACAILFGMLEWCPPGKVFVAMCFATRSLEALGAAANFVSIYAIAAHSFPSRISTVMGLLEGSFCVGLMIGPPVGGALYAADGFYLPFVVSGGIFMIFTLACGFFLPSPPDDQDVEEEGDEKQSAWAMFKRPLVPTVGFLIIVGSAVVGFVDVALTDQLHIVKPDITALEVGLIFLLPAGLVAVLSPVSGVITDRFPRLGLPVLVMGAMLICLSYLTIGPCPYLHFLPKNELWLLIISLGIGAIGTGSLVVSYQQLVTEAMAMGMSDTMATQGVIAGLNSLFGSVGSFIGPTMGGILVQEIGFAFSASTLSVLAAASAMLLLLVAVLQRLCFGGLPDPPAPDREVGDNDERKPLLPDRPVAV